MLNKSTSPNIAINSGTVEALKWFALVLMTIDHINKYLFYDRYAWMFDIGRIAMPLFGFVLAYNLSHSKAFENGVFQRVIKRLLIAGVIATLPFIALGGLAYGWWPLNILFTLAVATGCIFFLNQKEMTYKVGGIMLFIFGGLMVEFWWFSIAMCLFAYAYCKNPRWHILIYWILATASLAIVNKNFWALASLPVIFSATYIHVNLPRIKSIFYAYYPIHLAILYLIRRLM